MKLFNVLCSKLSSVFHDVADPIAEIVTQAMERHFVSGEAVAKVANEKITKVAEKAKEMVADPAVEKKEATPAAPKPVAKKAAEPDDTEELSQMWMARVKESKKDPKDRVKKIMDDGLRAGKKLVELGKLPASELPKARNRGGKEEAAEAPAEKPVAVARSAGKFAKAAPEPEPEVVEEAEEENPVDGLKVGDIINIVDVDDTDEGTPLYRVKIVEIKAPDHIVGVTAVNEKGAPVTEGNNFNTNIPPAPVRVVAGKTNIKAHEGVESKREPKAKKSKEAA